MIRSIHQSLAPSWGDGDERGQSLAEYALILALIAVVAIISLVFLGDVIASVMSMIGSTVDESTL